MSKDNEEESGGISGNVAKSHNKHLQFVIAADLQLWVVRIFLASC